MQSPIPFESMLLFGMTLLVFLGLMILALGLIRVLKFWGTPKF